MLTILRIEENGTCFFCSRQKEVAAVVLDGSSEVLLCWNDVRKHAQMRMRMEQRETPAAQAKPAASAVSAGVKP